MTAITETFPGTAITANQKLDVQSVPTGQDDYWVAAADMNKVLQAAVAIGRAIRANAPIAAITGAAEALTFPKIVMFTGAASGGLPVVTAVLTTDKNKHAAVGVAVLAQGGSAVSAAAATPVFLMTEGIIDGTWINDAYYWPDAAGDFSNTVIAGKMPIAYAISATKLYVNLAGIRNYNVVPATEGVYWGDATVNGTWRIQQSGNDLVIQRRESGSYVTKSTISA